MIDGALADEIVWAALDCPGAWVSARDVSLGPIVLGRMAALILAPLPGDAVFVSYAWARGDDGRKSAAGPAAAEGGGGVLPSPRQTWIELRD